MGLARFYVERVALGDLELDEAESNHASRVLRSQVGEDVLLFDGWGNEGFGTIRLIERRRVLVHVASTRFAPRDHEGRLALAVAMPKGDRQRNVIEKIVELGVDHLIPIETERSVAKVDQDAQARLARTMVEACKQSRRNRFLRIHPSILWKDFVRDSSWISHTRCVLHPDTKGTTAESLVFEHFERRIHPSEGAKSFVFAIGPEGGFTEEEVRLAADQGFRTLDLGDRILRVETAVAFAAVLGHLLTATPHADNRATQSH
jgi:16S rRNA (uracil1498-N3)-methyltransferase